MSLVNEQPNDNQREPLCVEDGLARLLSQGWDFPMEHTRKVMDFAYQVGKAELLWHSLDTLQRIATNRNGKVCLRYDWAPYSFYFEIVDPSRGVTVLNGGVIFHGKHDGGGNGGGPSYAVCLTPVDGWSIHT